MDLDNEDYFLASPNMKEVGKRTGLWSQADQARGVFNFKEVYSPSGKEFGHPNMWYRRTWQIYNLAAPSLKLETDRVTPYPFSIKPDKLISLEDMFRFNRDTFEGSPYDLTKGAAAGPYGNPNRYDRSRESAAYSGAGYFERGISLHRTAYSTVVQSRSWLPSILSGVVWFGQHAPHASTFAPIYGATTELAPSYTKGTIYKFSRDSSWWAACAVENYAEKMYNVIAVEIKAEQKLLETTGQQAVAAMDKKALAAFKAKGGDVDAPVVAKTSAPTAAEAAVKNLLTDWSINWGEHVTESWWALFERCLTKFRDGFILQHSYPPSTLKPVFYPAWWLGMIGYYEKGPAPFYAYSHPNAVPVAPNPSGQWPPQVTPPAIGDNEYVPTASELAAASSVKKSHYASKSKGHHAHGRESITELPTLATPAAPLTPPVATEVASSAAETPVAEQPCQPSSSNPMAAITTLSIALAALAGGYVLGRCHSRRNDAHTKYMAVPDLE